MLSRQGTTHRQLHITHGLKVITEIHLHEQRNTSAFYNGTLHTEFNINILTNTHAQHYGANYGTALRKHTTPPFWTRIAPTRPVTCPQRPRHVTQSLSGAGAVVADTESALGESRLFVVTRRAGRSQWRCPHLDKARVGRVQAGPSAEPLLGSVAISTLYTASRIFSNTLTHTRSPSCRCSFPPLKNC